MKKGSSGYERIDHPIPPLYDKDSRVLILGSFPSVKSREAAFFYGHPQNRFWKTLAGVLSEAVPEGIQDKRAFLLKNHVAVWDVIASCDIVGSSDSSIRNVVPNDLSVILASADIQQIFCNGARSYEYYCRYLEPQTGMKAKKLPSTSPANAAFSLERLKKEWSVICKPLKAAPAGIGQVLLDWYDYNARILPWRSDPTPYHVWISEIMLQQTRVEAVRKYYDRWMQELPDVESLAAVSEDKLLKLWEGLGYYNRVRNIKAAAKTIMEEYGGELPCDYQELLKLKGIGEYTAGAIASIAFGLPCAAVDGNVLRVFSRLLGETCQISLTGTRRSIAREVKRVMPTSRPGAYNQALMDLGAGICLPNSRPDCDSCPWESVCTAHEQGREMDYPVKSLKKRRRIENRGVFVIMSPETAGEGEEYIVLHKRPQTGLLPNLWEFPNIEGVFSLEKAREQAGRWGLKDVKIESMGEKKHVFSHVEWQMKGFLLTADEVPEELCRAESWSLVSLEEARKSYAIPSAFESYKKKLNLD